MTVCVRCGLVTDGVSLCTPCMDVIKNERYEERWVDNIIYGLRIMQRHGDVDIGAAHDVLFAGIADAEGIPEADQKILRKLNWRTELEGWAVYL